MHTVLAQAGCKMTPFSERILRMVKRITPWLSGLLAAALMVMGCRRLTAPPAPASPPPTRATLAPTAQALPTVGVVPTAGLAQGATILFDRLSLTLPAGLAAGAHGAVVPAVEGANTGPVGAAPEHLELKLDGYALPNKLNAPEIRVHPAEAYAQALPAAAQSLAHLRALLAAGAPPANASDLPAVPFLYAAQLFASNAKVIPFQNGQGVRTLTEYAQNFVSANNQDLFYHYEGLTGDGRYYVVAILPVAAPTLAEEERPDASLPPGGIAPPQRIGDNSGWPGYYAQVQQGLESLAPPAFTPSLEQLDALVSSLRINPAQAGPTAPAPSAAAGGWWAFTTTDMNNRMTLWAAEADGAGLRQIDTGPVVSLRHLSSRVAPAGGRVAVIASSAPGARTGLQLKLLSLATGELKLISPLATADLEAAAQTPGSPAAETLRAIVDEDSLVWAPDGQALAFLAAFESPVSDLYVYTLADGGLRRLSHNPRNGRRPAWSPDGRRLAYTLGGCASANDAMTAVWVADVQAGQATQLNDTPPAGASEEMVGWAGPTTLWVDTLTPTCGAVNLGQSNLRALELEGRQTQTSLWPGCFGGAWLRPAALDRRSGAFLTIAQLASAPPGAAPVLLLVRPGLDQPVQVDAEGGYAYLKWWPGAGFFSAGDQRILLVSPEGQVVRTLQMPVPGGEIFFSSTGSAWALVGSPLNPPEMAGLWAGRPDEAGQRIYAGAVYQSTWVPDTENFLFMGADGLYLARPENGWLNPVRQSAFSDQVNVSRTAWVRP